MELPTLRIELEGLKQNISHLFRQNNNELNKIIQETLEKQLTEEWISHEINQAVLECIKKSIAEVANNYRLQSVITNLLIDSITQNITSEK